MSTKSAYPVTIIPSEVGKIDWVPNIQETSEENNSPTIDTNSESDVSVDATVSPSIIAPRRLERCQNNVTNTVDITIVTGNEGKTKHNHEGAELLFDFANSNRVN